MWCYNDDELIGTREAERSDTSQSGGDVVAEERDGKRQGYTVTQLDNEGLFCCGAAGCWVV